MILEVFHDLGGFEEEGLDRKAMVLNINNFDKISFNNHAIIMFFRIDIHRNPTRILIHFDMPPHHVQLKVTLQQLNWVHNLPEPLVNIVKI